MGIYEAFSGLVKHPYLGAKLEGPLGVPKGLGRGVFGFGCHTLAGRPPRNEKLQTIPFSRTRLSNAIHSNLGFTWLYAQRRRVRTVEEQSYRTTSGIVSHQAAAGRL